ncbi:hypothetical protein PG996_011335 [Apiospora saccharicola]|uniref:Fucose-specific lectin n=1 Tax=Apiospora saccharicola TaxID=335842 RepID=A0ABR1UES0_9PEZI
MSRNTGEFYSTLEVYQGQLPKQRSIIALEASEKIACSSFAGSIEGLCELGDCRASVISPTPDSDPESQSSRLDRMRCGLSSRSFWAMVIGLNLLLAAAIGGGIAGGLYGNKSRSETASMDILGSAEVPSPEVPIGHTPTSQLSAISWVGSSTSGCICCKALFYQKNGTLMMSRTVGNGWVQDEILPSTESPLTLDVKNRTPLASTYTYHTPEGSDEDITVFYLDSNNNIRDLVTRPNDLSQWSKGKMWGFNVTANANSNLAAIGHYCPYCLNSNLLVYQREGGELYSIHGEDLNMQTRIDKTDDGTPLTILPGMNVSAGTAQIRLFYDRDGNIDEFISNEESPLGWSSGEINMIPNHDRASVLTAAPAITLGLVMALSNEGKITLSYLSSDGGWSKGGEYSNLTATFLDENGNVTTEKPQTDVAAIALSQDFHLYMMTKNGSRILEYEWSGAKPGSFEFVRTVL